MSEVPTGVIIAKFKTTDNAKSSVDALDHARKAGEIDFEDVAIVSRAEDGKLQVNETDDTSTGSGARIGGILGGVIGLLGGPAGVVIGAGAGALLGGLAAHGDAGIADERLNKLGADLTPGTSALVIVLSQAWMAEAETRLSSLGGEVVTASLRDELAKQFDAGDDSQVDSN